MPRALVHASLQNNCTKHVCVKVQVWRLPAWLAGADFTASRDVAALFCFLGRPGNNYQLHWRCVSIRSNYFYATYYWCDTSLTKHLAMSVTYHFTSKRAFSGAVQAATLTFIHSRSNFHTLMCPCSLSLHLSPFLS